jgi:hypothetical protein
MSPFIKPALRVLAAIGLTAGLSACGSTAATNNFKGEQHEVAKVISNLQSDVRATEQQKVCSNDLAAPVVSRLNATPGGCSQALKGQLTEIDNTEATVESVQITGTGSKRTATARVKSSYKGKNRVATVMLVNEGGKWKILSVA